MLTLEACRPILSRAKCDALGRVSRKTFSAGQLLTEIRTGYSGSYTYDGNGNRLTRTVGGVTETYAYDDGDKLLSVSVGGSAIKSYGYDAAGRTTSVVSSAGTTTLAYDFEGRATSISGPGVSQSNLYNGLDTRVGSTTNSVARTFLRDGAYVTDPVLSDGAATYTPGVSERRGSATTFLHNGLKNADAQSGTGQTVIAARQYDAFGNVASSTGTWTGPFGYAGGFGYQEDATGLKLLGHRYYDSSTGRFLTRDPIKDGRNWYVYCGNDPVGFVDSDGLQMRRPGPPARPPRGITKWVIDSIISRRPLKPNPTPTVKPPTRKVPPIHPGKQGKHIPGHRNFIPGKSEITTDPKKLIEEGAGRGEPVGEIPRGKPGFKERFDFGYVIGQHVDRDSGKKSPSTVGIIVYDGKGEVHVYPGKPK